VLINTVDTGSKRVFTWGSTSRNPAPNDCHSLANRSFSGSRSGAVALLGSACCWPTQVPLARSVVAGRQPTGTRYVERPREQPGIAAAKLKDYTRRLVLSRLTLPVFQLRWTIVSMWCILVMVRLFKTVASLLRPQRD
jgi:hypothetical protein